MGSIQRENTSDKDGSKEVNILVTGFGPFRDAKINPSWEIARRLGASLDVELIREGNKEDGSRDGESEKVQSQDIPISESQSNSDANTDTNSPQPQKPKKSTIIKANIIVHPTPIKVAYESVRTLIPTLWDSPSDIESNPETKSRIDYAIHIGMAYGRKFYSIEKQAHRNGYTMRDVDGKSSEGWTEDWAKADMPVLLGTSIDVDGVCGAWRKGVGMGVSFVIYFCHVCSVFWFYFPMSTSVVSSVSSFR